MRNEHSKTSPQTAMKPPEETHRTWEKSSWWGYQLFSIPRSSSFKVALALGRAPLSSPPTFGLAKVLEMGKDQGLRKDERHPLLLLLEKRARLFNNISSNADNMMKELSKSESISRVELNLREKEGAVEKGRSGRKRRFLRMARSGVEEVGERKLERQKKKNTETFLRLLVASKTHCVERLSVPFHQSFLSCPQGRRRCKIIRILK